MAMLNANSEMPLCAVSEIRRSATAAYPAAINANTGTTIDTVVMWCLLAAGCVDVF